jgi:hypothetical protein
MVTSKPPVCTLYSSTTADVAFSWDTAMVVGLAATARGWLMPVAQALTSVELITSTSNTRPLPPSATRIVVLDHGAAASHWGPLNWGG